MANPIKSLSKKIIALLVCAVLSFGFIYTVSAQSTIVNASASSSQPQVGSTLTVALTVSNVQNLAGIDATLQWNPSILTLTNSALNLGDSHSNGVLHGTNLNTDSNNLNSGDIYVQETKVSGSYELVAQSIGASNPGFAGSGTIATLTFSVIHAGSAGLSLQTELADHPPIGENAQNINHQDTASSVSAVTSGSSSTPTQNSPAPSPTVPEFPIITVIAIIIIATATIVTSAKMFKKQEKLSTKQ